MSNDISRDTMMKKIPMPESLLKWTNQYGFDCSDINSRIENGMSALMTAAMKGDVEIVSQLLIQGADTNLVNDDHNNALWFACFSSEILIIRDLLQHGCAIDNQNVNGATALIYASSAGKFEIVRELVSSGADVDKQTLDGFNAMDSATTIPILQFLISVCSREDDVACIN